MDEHTIHLTRDGNRYLVATVPPCPDRSPQLFEDHRTARGYAGGLRMVTGWTLVDETETAHG